MSQENVEIVRRMLEASDRRDTAAVFAVYDPDIEWDVSDGKFVGDWMRSFVRGHTALHVWLRDWVSAWQDVEYDHEKLIEAGEHVVHFLRYHARGRRSGIDFESPPYAQVWTLREGKIVRMKVYAARGEALKAAGLSE